MAFSCFWINLSIIFNIFIIISGQKLVIDKTNGSYQFIEGDENDAAIKPVCFIENSKLADCAKDQYPVLALKTKAPETENYRTVQVDYYYIWPLVNITSVPIPSYPYPLTSYYWVQTPIWELEKEVLLQIVKEKQKKKQKDDIFDKNFDPHFRANVELSETPAIIPMNVSGCVPVTNSICTKEQIESYETYLSQFAKKESYRSEYNKFTKYRTSSNASSVTSQMQSINSNEMTEDSMISRNETSSFESVGINAKEYAEIIGRTVIQNLQSSIESDCPMIVQKLNVDIYHSESDDENEQKVEGVMDVEIANGNNSSETKANSQSSYHNYSYRKTGGYKYKQSSSKS